MDRIKENIKTFFLRGGVKFIIDTNYFFGNALFIKKKKKLKKKKN